MARIRNRNPFDVSGWTGEIEINTLPPVAFPGLSGALVLPADAGRLWILATSDASGSNWSLWPNQVTGQIGIRPGPDQNHLLIHNASYPSLVQGTWYLNTIAGPGTVYIITGSANYDRTR